MRPRLLDLFCGAGGAAMGYHRAGFDVVGVDITPQPHYPFEFHQDDAIDVLLSGSPYRFDAIHASPPCQLYSAMNNRDRSQCPDLIEPTRNCLVDLGIPWVMENVDRSPMRPVLVLCGCMFGLRVRRKRLFESSVLIFSPGHCHHPPDKDFVGVYGDHPGVDRQHPDGFTRAPRARSLVEAQEAMGMDWANWHGTKEAIPPAYTEWIGDQLMRAVRPTAS